MNEKNKLKLETIQKVINKEIVSLLGQSLFIQENYFPFFKYKIETTDDLSIFQTVDKGIENRIKKYIPSSNHSWRKNIKTNR